MKKFYYLLAAFLAAFTVSCGEPSLSSSEVLDYLDKEYSSNYNFTVDIPIGIVQNDKISIIQDIQLNAFKGAGLITMEDTVIVRRYYSDKPGKYIQITDKGRSAITEDKNSALTVSVYTFKYDKIEDMKLLGSRTVKNCNATFQSYATFYSGVVTNITSFGAALGVSLNDTYPFYDPKGSGIEATTIDVIFNGSEAVYIENSSTSTISVDDMENYYEKAWIKSVNNFDKRN